MIRGNEGVDSPASKAPNTEILNMGRTEKMREINGRLSRTGTVVEENSTTEATGVGVGVD